ncbi:MAG: hypothetical protein E7111_02265 [Bacteroidales bacterium]|nr:hypothetical protein [Bacteroidales bacterium]
MRISRNYTLTFVLLLVCQLFLSNYACLGPYIMLSMLPTMILCLPMRVGTVASMLIAFACGFATDLCCEGLLGINVAALLPVAFCRRGLIRIFLGEDLIARNDNFSIRKNGLGKVSLAQVSSCAIFLAAYIFLDGAGTRPFWFCTARFFASLACCWPLGLGVVNILTVDDRK